MILAHLGGKSPQQHGPQGAYSCNGTQKEPLPHPLGGDLCRPAAADQRHRLSWWAARGLLPQGLAPSAIAAAYTRATGRPPARDLEKKATRTYSAWELLQALAQLSPPLQQLGAAAPPPPPPAPPPPPVDPLADPLAVIWGRTLQALQLPSTRMLLSQQARLLLLSPSPYALAGPGELVALVRVVGNWLPMVESRRDLIANALGKVLGCPVCVALIAAGGEL